MIQCQRAIAGKGLFPAHTQTLFQGGINDNDGFALSFTLLHIDWST